MIPLNDYRFKGHYLSISEKGHAKTVIIPQGLIQYNKGVEFFVDGEDIIAKLGNDMSRIFPLVPYKVKTSKGLDITISIPSKFSERNAGKKILLDHYMGLPSHGLLVNAYVDEDKEPDGKKKPDEKKTLVACGCIDRLYYAMPVARKEVVICAGKHDDYLDELDNWKSVVTRSGIVDDLHIVWISRLAVDPAYERRGIASKMAEEMGNIAHSLMLPRADFIEVFMSCADDEKDSISGEKNLYCKAGFIQYDKFLKSSQMVFPKEEDKGYVTTKKIYCYKDLRDKK